MNVFYLLSVVSDFCFLRSSAKSSVSLRKSSCAASNSASHERKRCLSIIQRQNTANAISIIANANGLGFTTNNSTVAIAISKYEAHSYNLIAVL